jgi:dihydroorotase
VIARSTDRPATAVRRPELGHLGVGAPADVALLRLERGRFALVDTHKTRMDARVRLSCEMTIKDGLVHHEREGWSRPRWDRLGRYESQGDPRWDGTGQDQPTRTAAVGATAR